MEQAPPSLPLIGGSPAESSREGQSEKPEKVRSGRVPVACNACRTRKSACSGGRPRCRQCQQRDTECQYLSRDRTESHSMILKRQLDLVTKRNADLEQLFDDLGSLSDLEVMQFLSAVRKGSDPVSSLQSIKSGQQLGLYRPSGQQSALGLFPSVENSFDLQMAIRYPMTHAPVDTPKSPLWRSWVAPGLSNHVTGADKPPPTAGADAPQAAADEGGGPSSSPAAAAAAAAPSVSAKDGVMPIDPALLYHANISPVLQQLRIDFWTSVPVTNEFAAGAIAFYINVHHPSLALFDIDLFLRDLVDCKLEFCTPLLVSSLLAFACLGYTAVDRTAAAKSYEFGREAEMLWTAEKSTPDSVAKIAALNLLYITKAAQGQAEKAAEYLAEMEQRARTMKLYGVADAIDPAALASLAKEQASSLAFGAWGAFNNNMMQSLFFPRRPCEYPPAVPMPVDRRARTMTGELCAADGSADCVGACIVASCELWVIVAQTLCVYHHLEASPQQQQQQQQGLRAGPSPAFALGQYDKMLRLSSSLPPCMKRDENSPHHVLVFYVWFHIAVVELMRPFTVRTRASRGSGGAASGRGTADEQMCAIQAMSFKQLKQLTLDCRALRPAVACANMMWHPVLIFAANAVLGEEERDRDPGWRAYFHLCFGSYVDFGRNYPFGSGLAKALVGMAVGRGAIDMAEASVLMGALQRQLKEREAIDGAFGGGFAMDMDLAATDREAATVDTLIEKMEDMTNFMELTDGVV